MAQNYTAQVDKIMQTTFGKVTISKKTKIIVEEEIQIITSLTEAKTTNKTVTIKGFLDTPGLIYCMMEKTG